MTIYLIRRYFVIFIHNFGPVRGGRYRDKMEVNRLQVMMTLAESKKAASKGLKKWIPLSCWNAMPNQHAYMHTATHIHTYTHTHTHTHTYT